MRVTMICENALPMSTGGGPKLNQYAICEELRQRGHQLQIVWITTQTELYQQDQIALQALVARDILITLIQFGECSPSFVSRVLTNFHPDVIFALGTWGISWAASYNRDIPRICMLGDPEHYLPTFRRQLRDPNPMTYEEIVQIHIIGMNTKEEYLNVLGTCTASFCAAQHSVEWFRKQGFDVEYVPMPVVEPAYLGWRRRKEDMPNNEKPRILMAGHLGGIATLSSLYYLADEVLPNMDDIGEYDWHICGGDTLQTDLVNRFKKYPQIKFRGYVEDIRKEILQADIFLCTTATTVGVRTRLVEAMALGSCIVAHSNNAVGQPEFVHGENIIMSTDGKTLAGDIEDMSKSPEARYEMGLKARETYETYFRTELSAGRIVQKMEEVTA